MGQYAHFLCTCDRVQPLGWVKTYSIFFKGVSINRIMAHGVDTKRLWMVDSGLRIGTWSCMYSVCTNKGQGHVVEQEN